MNIDQLKELKLGIIQTAVYYNRDLTPGVLTMMVEDLSDLDFDAVSDAYLKYRRSPKNKTFPLPAQIRELVEPVADDESEARDAVEKIKLAISKFGYPHGTLAKDFIGEIGWSIVNGLGGWLSVCESDFTYNPAMIAQARTRAMDLVKFGTRPTVDQTPKLERPNLRLIGKDFPCS